MRDAVFEQRACRLKRGDVLVLFSDGVTEAYAPDTDQEFGEQRLIAAVQGKRNDASASLLEAINAELLPLHGSAGGRRRNAGGGAPLLAALALNHECACRLPSLVAFRH
jgi:Stage II sporulation protein E (SpoIIE)